MRTVRDVMCGVVEVLHINESASDAACYLAAHGEDAVPLCLDDGSLAGLVSSRDIVAKVVAKGLDPQKVPLSEVAEPDSALGLDVNAPLDDAVALMCGTRRSRLPVTDGNRVVGLITQRDAARALVFRPPWSDT